MSTPQEEVKADVTQVETAVVADATSWWSKVKPYVIPAAGLVVGWLVGHYL